MQTSERSTRSSSAHFPLAAIIAAAIALALPAAAPAAPTLLSVSKSGTGAGTVKSSPAGIECGSSCMASFEGGTQVTLSAASGPNTLAVAWSGCDSVTGEGKCVVTMSSPRSVTATFNLNLVELKVARNGTSTGTVTSAPSGINCGATCSAKFGESTTVTLTGAPGANTDPVKWSGCTSVNGENKCLVTMSAAKEVTATFNLSQRQLSVAKGGTAATVSSVTSSPAGIGCGEACQASFMHGTLVTLTAFPGIHTKPVQWSGCDTVNGENKCLVTMSAAKEVTATFELQPGFSFHTVAVEKIGTGTGTVTASTGSIDCGSVCSDELVSDTVLTLTATPAPGSVFSHWSGGNCAGTEPNCTKTINSSRTVKAVFTVIGTRTLTVTKAGNGQGTVTSKPAGGIDCGPTCVAGVAAGTKVTLVAAAASGSDFAGWSGACTGTGLCKVTMSEARNVTVTFTDPSVPSSDGTAVIAAAAKVKGGVARIKVLCNGPAPCKGTLRLGAKLGAKGKTVAIGQASFDLAPGASTMLAVKLSRKAKQLLASEGHLKVRVAGTGIHPHPVALKAPVT